MSTSHKVEETIQRGKKYFFMYFLHIFLYCLNSDKCPKWETVTCNQNLDEKSKKEWRSKNELRRATAGHDDDEFKLIEILNCIKKIKAFTWSKIIIKCNDALNRYCLWYIH